MKVGCCWPEAVANAESSSDDASVRKRMTREKEVGEFILNLDQNNESAVFQMRLLPH